MKKGVGMMFVQIIFSLTGIMMLFFGYFIWKHKMLSLLAGYDEGKVADKEGLAKYAGSNLILMGILILLISVIGMILKANTAVPYLLIVVFITIRMVVGCRKFEKR
ncbi:hypothetical protein JOC37_000272 [Desulfohalotomaculum tongense]|uniref:DUF3784 domain-containing protein n=1 Tax=Desulforadius tongensis TaxID=1216062 RepID=UPI0019590CBC|nr:DUF3784 domain-containing protein [Desulforadius tongensis]MBM7853907.1 hypothetical protein [Desulforadius tongensis]